MEWVETIGRSIEEAKSKALDQLGVAEDDAEFDILDEPRSGLFGRVRGEARVRARVRPTQPRPKLDRRDRKKKGDAPVAGAAAVGDDADQDTDVAGERPGGGARSASRSRRGGRSKPPSDAAAASDEQPAAPSTSREPGQTRPRARRESPDATTETKPRNEPRTDRENNVDAQQVGDEAQRFVQGLVDAFGVSGTTTIRRDGDDIEVVVEGTDLGLLVGPRGSTLQAVQELTRVASQRRLGDHDTRLRVDIAGYRERRREALGRFAQQVAAQVVAEGAPKRLEPMSSSDRKIIHDVLADVDGVSTRSEGDDPQRCVVIEPTNG